MPKILITGNGFDLYHGLPTKYEDFISVLNSVVEDEITFEEIYSKTSSAKKIIENVEPFEFDEGKLSKLKNLLEDNLWFNFFSDEHRIETWIDFENKIDYSLKILFDSINRIQTKFLSGSQHKKSVRLESAFFSNRIDVLGICLRFGVFSNTVANSYYINPDYLVEKHEMSVGFNVQSFANALMGSFTEFKEIFSLYFETFVFPLYDTFKVDENIMSHVDVHYTFNYTPTAFKMYEFEESIFIHGISCENHSVVLGINHIPEIEIDSKKFFIPFTKNYQKFSSALNLNFIADIQNVIDQQKYQVIFFGHSLDESDRFYIERVFNRASKSNKRMTITIGFISENDKNNKLVNLISICGEKIIYDLMNDRLLNFYPIDSYEFKLELFSIEPPKNFVVNY